MLKKKLVTIVAAVFCVALVTAQESGVFKTTTGLIEDGAIDSLKFGTEDGSGVIFGQYDNAGKAITLGWGNSLSDTLWLSVFDSYYFKNVGATTTETAQNDATADDGINIDYTKTTRSTSEANLSGFQNDLGVGVGINNKLGFQLVWAADYNLYKNPASIPVDTGTNSWKITGPVTAANGTTTVVKSEVNNPGTGENTQKEWTKVLNHKMDNNFTVNFKGIGIEDVGDNAFFVKLNKVYFKWNNTTQAGDYTETSTTNGKKTAETTLTAKAADNTLTPGLNFDLGLNLISNDVATVKFVYEDDFNMTFNPRTNEAEKAEKTFGTTTEVTKKSNYKVDYGKYLKWENTFEPKVVSEFEVLEGLQLKAQLALPVTIGQTIDDVDTYESSSSVETRTKAIGYTELSTAKKTTTGVYGTAQNSNTFKTTFKPELSAGFVYQVTPGKFNVNFGASAKPYYFWTVTTKTNPGVNTVEKTETRDNLGNVTSYTDKVTVVGDNDAETKVTDLTALMTANINLGATWFFTDNISFDVYFLNSFSGSIFDTTNAGASVTVKF